MAEGGTGGQDDGKSAVEKDWVVPIARDMDLKNEKHWAIRALYDLFGWRTIQNNKGTFDVDQESIGPEKPQE